MNRGSQLQHTITVNKDLSECPTVILSFSQSGRVILEKTKEDMVFSENAISFDLSQDDTMKFRSGTLRFQIVYTMDDGTKDTSDIGTTTVRELLRKEKW